MLSFIISKPSPLKSLYSNKGKKLIDIITAKIFLPSVYHYRYEKDQKQVYKSE